MNKEILERLQGLESIMHELHHNLRLMEYVTYGLHQQTFNLSNNAGLVWITRSIMAGQIVIFYKIIGSKEKFSFGKIVNVSKILKLKVDHDLIESGAQELQREYDKTNFEEVRSKYIAHQDLDVPILKTDLTTVTAFTKSSFELFDKFAISFDANPTPYSDEVIDDFMEIFATINEYERVKATILAAEIHLQNKVSIDKLAEAANRK